MSENLKRVEASLLTMAQQYSQQELAWDCGPLLEAAHVAIKNATNDQVLGLVSEIHNLSTVVRCEVREFDIDLRQHLAQLLCDRALESRNNKTIYTHPGEKKKASGFPEAKIYST